MLPQSKLTGVPPVQSAIVLPLHAFTDVSNCEHASAGRTQCAGPPFFEQVPPSAAQSNRDSSLPSHAATDVPAQSVPTAEQGSTAVAVRQSGEPASGSTPHV